MNESLMSLVFGLVCGRCRGRMEVSSLHVAKQLFFEAGASLWA